MRSTSPPGSTEKQTACLDALMPFRNRYQSGWPVSEAYCWRSSVSVGASLGRNKARAVVAISNGGSRQPARILSKNSIYGHMVVIVQHSTQRVDESRRTKPAGKHRP